MILDLENLVNLLREFKYETQKPAIKLTARRSDSITAISSKFGGTPYLPKNYAYPTCAKGNPLKLLAQFNFEKLPQLANFPTSGILQFFVLPDNVHGMQKWPPEFNKQGSYRVIYHEEILPISEIMTEFPEIKWVEKNTKDMFPFKGEFLITGELVEVFANNTTVEFREQFKKFCENQELLNHFESLFWTDGEYERHWLEKEKTMSPEKYSVLKNKDIEQRDLIFKIFSYKDWHLIGGYPYFRQQDIRKNENLRKYDTVLFQMSAERVLDHEDYIMWGDCGVANFFINQADLQNLKFDDVLYNWDC